MIQQRIVHPIKPVYDRNSRILILGSFPSVASRSQGFFYGHPRNRFWKVLSEVLQEKEPESIEEKREFLLRNHIALWDVIASCEITGSADSSIRNALANDLSLITDTAQIRKIFVNGRTAEKLYQRYLLKETGTECLALPSTSPANAAWSLERLTDRWKMISEYLEEK